MGTVDLPKGGKTARPQTSGAYLPKTGGNRQDSLDRIIREHAAMLSNRLGTKLPGEPRLDEKAYNFISQNYRVISGGFQSHNHDFTVKGDKKNVTDITAMLENEGYHFNTGEIEKSQANRQYGIDDLEVHTNNMLRQNAGIGSFIDSQKANLVAACVFKDNEKKPKTVTDLRLAVNIPETELIDQEVRFKAEATYLIREIICKHLSENMENAEVLKTATDEEAAVFLNSLLNDRLEINAADIDGHLQNIDSNDEIEALRNSGFSAASNLIVSILNAVNLDCEFLNNLKEKRQLLIREYEETYKEVLPDEHYEITLRYFSKAQLSEEREIYDKWILNLGRETQRLWDLLEVIYQDSKSVFKVNDFEDLAKKNKNRINDLIKNGTLPYDPQKPIEAPFAAVREEKEKIRVLLARMEERIKNISDSMYPVERQISEERLLMLRDEFSFVEDKIDPYNLQPGILVDIELTFIKRKRTTLDAMSLALGRFLDNVSKCFRDVS